MGLRIVNNTNSVRANRQYQYANNSLSKSLEKLSAGLEITSGSDSPAGLIISEQLRGQISGIKQAIENSAKAINVIGTAEGALQEVNQLLLTTRKLAIDAANLGTSDQDQTNANQAEIDSAINSIDRIASTTQYAGKKLLNGESGFDIGQKPDGVKNIQVNRVQLSSNSGKQISYEIKEAAEFANINIDVGSNTLDKDSTVQITGTNGSQQISFAAGSSLQDIVEAIDQVNENTGVTARTENTSIILSSTDVGSTSKVSIEDIDNDGFLIGTNTSSSNQSNYSIDTGVDIAGSINGATAQGIGRSLQINTSQFSGKITFEYPTATGAVTAVASDASVGVTGRDAAQVPSGPLQNDASGSFTINNSGLLAQLGAYTNPNNQESVGIENLAAYNLGVSSGRLSSIVSGGANDLTSNPDRAVSIIDEAITDIATTRARLGAFQKNTLETNTSTLQVALENIIASESRIRDLDFASETASFTKSQILVQAGTSILAQANTSSISVISLLK